MPIILIIGNVTLFFKIVNIFIVLFIIVVILLFVIVVILIPTIITDYITFIPQRAGAGCLLLLPFFSTCVAEFIAAPATGNIRDTTKDFNITKYCDTTPAKKKYCDTKIGQ
jgi:hypothetical protein